MSSPVQKRGSCGHNHKKCERCHEKGVGDDPCVKKQDCQICKALTPAQVQQLSIPTCKTRKERGEQKKSEDIGSTTPTLVNPSDVTLLGQVSSDKQNPRPSRRRSVLMAPQGLVNGSTAVNQLLMTSSPLMTSGVRGFHV